MLIVNFFILHLHLAFISTVSGIIPFYSQQPCQVDHDKEHDFCLTKSRLREESEPKSSSSIVFLTDFLDGFLYPYFSHHHDPLSLNFC